MTDRHSILLVCVIDNARHHARLVWCRDEFDSLLDAVRAAVFGGFGHEREAREIRDELLTVGAWYPEGDAPLFLFRIPY